MSQAHACHLFKGGLGIWFNTTKQTIPLVNQLLGRPLTSNTVWSVCEPINFVNALQHQAVVAVLALLDAPRVSKGTEEQR